MADFPNIIKINPDIPDDIRLPIDEDFEYLDFYLPENNNRSNIKKFISPYQDDAFSEEVLFEVVNEKLGFNLSFGFWEHINESFAHYWDEEVGIGGCLYAGAMFSSIRRNLIDNLVYCPDNILEVITAAIEDFISSIPGVYIDAD